MTRTPSSFFKAGGAMCLVLAISAQAQRHGPKRRHEVLASSTSQSETTAAAKTAYAGAAGLAPMPEAQNYIPVFADISSWLVNSVMFQRADTALTQTLNNIVFAGQRSDLQAAIDTARSAGKHFVYVTNNQAITDPVTLADGVDVVCAPDVSINADFTVNQPYMVVGSSLSDAGLWCKLDGRNSPFVGSGLYLANVRNFRGRIEVWNTGKRKNYTSYGVRIDGCTDCQIDSIVTRNHGLRVNTGAGVDIAGTDANLRIGGIDAEYSQETDGNGDLVIENTSGPVYIDRVETASNNYSTSADGVHIRSVPGGVNDVHIGDIDAYGNRAAAVSLGDWVNRVYIDALRSSYSGARCMEVGGAQGPQQTLQIGSIQCLNPNRYLHGIIGAVVVQGPNAGTLVTRDVTIGSIQVIEDDATPKVNTALLIRNTKAGQTVSGVSVSNVLVDRRRGTLTSAVELNNVVGGTLKNIDIGSLTVNGAVTHEIVLPTRGTIIHVHGPTRPR